MRKLNQFFLIFFALLLAAKTSVATLVTGELLQSVTQIGQEKHHHDRTLHSASFQTQLNEDLFDDDVDNDDQDGDVDNFNANTLSLQEHFLLTYVTENSGNNYLDPVHQYNKPKRFILYCSLKIAC